MCLLLFAVSQHRLFNEHLVSASSNPALAMRRKKHTEKEVHADLVSIVSVRLREGYSIREVNITKGDLPAPCRSVTWGSIPSYTALVWPASVG